MTRIANYGIASAFRAAKDFLATTWQGQEKEQCICFAIIKAYTRGRITAQQSSAARGVITDRIGREAYVTEWLREALGLPAFPGTNDQRMAYRHAWLDSLIDEFEGRPFATHWVVK